MSAPAWGATTNIGGTWQVQSSANIPASQTGNDISSPGYNTLGWLPEATDDAGGGLTEEGALLQNADRYPGMGNSVAPVKFPSGTPTQPTADPASQLATTPNPCSLTNSFDSNPDLTAYSSNSSLLEGPSNVFYSNNMYLCWGAGSVGGAPSNVPFTVPWWFRTDFSLPSFVVGHDVKLVVNGVMGQADVWMNGVEVATQAQVTGDYTTYTFDVSNLMQSGTNSIALEVYPNNPKTMFTLDTVDWNQPPEDNDTGIQFPIQLDSSDQFAVSNAYVTENNAADLSSSALTAKADVTNNTVGSQSGTVTATITPPSGGTPITVSQSVTIPALTTQTVTFAPANYPSLVINNPQVWWPYHMGGQPLYTLDLSAADSGSNVSDSTSETFGIRTITSYLTPPSNMAYDGVRWFAVNGKPFVFTAGGWSENLFLHYSSADIANQISLIKSMGLDGIRTEGKEMPPDFYEQFDKAGLLVDAGFQCCDKWQFSATNATQNDYNVMYDSALTIGQQLRNHPSVLNMSWSDNNPTAEQEQVSVNGFSQAGFQEPLVSSAEYKTSPILGPSGEKEGPYGWVSPTYWYDTTHEDPTDSSFTDVGGSWGFDSEESAGDTVDTIDSLDRFLAPSDLTQLWAEPTAQTWHTDPDAASSFGSLLKQDQATAANLGLWTSSPPSAAGNVSSGSSSISTVSMTTPLNDGTLMVGMPVTDSASCLPPGTVLAGSTAATATGAVTAGSSTITGVTTTNPQSFQVGEFITSSSNPQVFVGGTTITSVTGTSPNITLGISQPAYGNATSGITTGPASMTVLTPGGTGATCTHPGDTITAKAGTALSGGPHVQGGLNQYVEESQVENYETQRAQFEAFIDHSTNYPTPSTGTDYWMLNKGWPTLLWALYNDDNDQAGSFFGSKKANEPVHVLYAYDTGGVTVDNLTGTTQSGLSVESKVLNVDGTAVTDDQTATGITLPSQGVDNNVITPVVPATTSPPATPTDYWVELSLSQNGTVIDRNVYWLSTQPDIVNWNSSLGSTSATMSQYMDNTALQSLAQNSDVTVAANSRPESGPDGDDTATNITLTNTGSTVAFFLRADIRRGSGSTEADGDNEVLPTVYSDNDITLFPGESQTITAQYASSALAGSQAVVSVYGWNVPYSDTAPSAAPLITAPRANGTPLSNASTATPGVSNTPGEMAALRRRVSVVDAKAAWHHGKLTVRVSCRPASGAPCTGAVAVTAQVKKRSHKRTHLTTVSLGKRSYSVPVGTSRTVRFVLSKRARAKLGKRPALVARAIPRG
jgi:hypothetical protein